MLKKTLIVTATLFAFAAHAAPAVGDAAPGTKSQTAAKPVAKHHHARHHSKTAK